MREEFSSLVLWRLTWDAPSTNRCLLVWGKGPTSVMGSIIGRALLQALCSFIHSSLQRSFNVDAIILFCG